MSDRERAVIYSRYSSHAQGEQSIEGQLAEGHKYAALHGYTVVHEYIDRAISGRSDNRAAFQQMLRDTGKGAFTVIIVWKVDRFGRNREEIAVNKLRCKRAGVRVEYVAERIPTTPEGVILESVLEGFAEYYSLQLSQNVRRGMAASAEKAQSCGGKIPLGYIVNPASKKYEIDPATAPIVKRMFEEYAAGSTMSEIVKRLNDDGLRTRAGKPFTVNSMRSVIRSERYTGVFLHDGVRVEGGVPAIISRETYERVSEMLAENKKQPAHKWSASDFVLTGKAVCGYCGAGMIGVSGTGKAGARYAYYACVA